MPRNHKRKVKGRNYVSYTEAELEAALTEVVEGRSTQYKASLKYGIPLGTLNNKYHGRHIKPFGAPTKLTLQEEREIVQTVSTCGEWGYPLSETDIRLIVKHYLQGVGECTLRYLTGVLLYQIIILYLYV